MGDHADDAVDAALNGGHWSSGIRWGGKGRRMKPRAKIGGKPPAPLTDFADLIKRSKDDEGE